MTSITRKLDKKQGQSYLSEKQMALEDSYYNNHQNFQEDYSVNHPDVNVAATKIQAQFRGHKTRRDLEKMKEENKEMIDYDQQDLDYSHEQSTNFNDEYQGVNDKQQFGDELTEEKQRAAISIQAQFRGFQVRKHLRESFDNTNEHEQVFEKTSAHFSSHRDFGGSLTAADEIEADENDDSDRPHLERKRTEFSEDFQRHTQKSRDSNFYREQQQEIPSDEDDMSDPNQDKAATRIQASYRGYKTRKELGSVSGQPITGHDQHHPSSSSSQVHDEYDTARNKNILSPSAEGNKVPIGEDDDHAAAVKIQAAYRGYRVRKDLEK